VRRCLKFHRDQPGAWRHPRDLGAAEVVAFLNHLANVESVAAGTQNQALNAISFLYTQVLGLELGNLGEFLPAGKRRRVPVVLSKVETQCLLAALAGTYQFGDNRGSSHRGRGRATRVQASCDGSMCRRRGCSGQ